MFKITFTEQAMEDLEVFPKSQQKWIVSALESELSSNAALETDDRKPLHLDGLAGWEFRLGQVRVFYDVDIQNGTVRIEAVGKKFYV